MNQPLNSDDLPIRGHRVKVNLYDDFCNILNLEEILKEMPDVSLIDGARGVSLEVKRQLENKEHLSEKRDRKIVIYNSLTKEEVIK